MNLLQRIIKKAFPGQPLASVPDTRGSWWPIIREGFTGAWQRNIEIRTADVLTCSAVRACVTLIASDIAKMHILLVEQDADGIWNEVENPAFSPVLRKPNTYQTRIQFIQQWMMSKLIWGNTYVLKGRDRRNIVTDEWVLDPMRVRTLVAPDGSVFYALNSDSLTHVTDSPVVPASEIIHDRNEPIYHPLYGTSPIAACGLAAIQGLRVQENSANFFGNGSTPGGVLTAPTRINPEEARIIRENWEGNLSGPNYGRVAVLGSDMKYQPIQMISAQDAQLIEQLKWTAEDVCRAFHVPPYMIGVGPMPTYNNIEALNQQYYAQCLQIHIESIEALQDEGLGLGPGFENRLGTEFDLSDLLRMDTATNVKAASDAIGSGALTPNEARKDYFGKGPVEGGDSPYLQQQNFSLEALAKRDAQADPFSSTTPTAQLQQPADQGISAEDEAKLAAWLVKAMA